MGILLTLLFQHIQIELIILPLKSSWIFSEVKCLIFFSLQSPRLRTWDSSLTSFLFHISSLSWGCTVSLSCFLYFIYFWLLPLLDLLQQSPHCLIDICTSFLDFCKSINYKTTSIMSHVLKVKICLNSYWVLLCLKHTLLTPNDDIERSLWSGPFLPLRVSFVSLSFCFIL